MNLKRIATIVLVAAALAAWLAGAATSNRPLPPPIIDTPHAIDARGQDLANEIARLHERLRPTMTPRQPGRNLFTFKPTAVQAPAPAPVSPAPALVEAPVARPAEPALKLSGIAEDEGPEGPVRTAFISGGGQLFMVREGDDILTRYRVTKISPDVVELADTAAGTTRRLVMR